MFAAERLQHGDDTMVPVLAKGKAHTGRCWAYVPDDRPFGAHVEAHLACWPGLQQADAYSGYNRIYAADRPH